MAVHGGITFAVEHPKLARKWELNSNSLVVIGLRDELELFAFKDSFERQKIVCSWFYEPDINNEMTAGAAILNKDQAKQLRSKQLLLKGIK